MKKSSFVKGSAALLAVIGAAAIFSGCSSSNGPKMLENRDYIPAPTSQPGQPAVQPETPAIEPIKLDQAKDVTVANTTSTLAKPVITGEKGGPILSPAHSSSSHAVATGAGTKYTVQKGDSLWKIAKKHGVSIRELASCNKMDTNAHVKVGQVLVIPANGKVVHSSTEKSSKSVAQATKKTTTKTQSTKVASTTSKKTATAAAPAADKTKATANAAPAQTANAAPAADAAKASVTAPAADAAKASAAADAAKASTTAQAAPQSNFLPHTVKEGDSWETISDMYGVSVADLKKANPSIAGDTQLKSGTVVNIPEE